MKFRLYDDVHEFSRNTYDVLMRHEAQNMIPLGNIIIGCEGKDKSDWRDPKNWIMATVSDETGIKLTAIMTPPHNITLYATDNIVNEEAVITLIDGLEELDGVKIPGVMTEKGLADLFRDIFTKRYGLSHRVVMSQRIYELTEVNPDVKQVGNLRIIEEKDMFFFPFWMEAFNSANIYGRTDMAIPQEFSNYSNRLLSKKMFLLEDENGVPVSMAGFTREMETAIGVAFVFTPPYFRGKGYASSCVAKLSQLALDRGYKRCVLYTDLLNPTSNSIYQKIGYKPVCDSMMYKFE